ncbi:uncharacterized protein LOC120553775 [Perca fluviatilis]|uniref:uncharacterized protein LOC120553775 n=1 Tax=Perca fluviatilis TaxID=8168 RepID=UPI001962751C|nr:uncharacterized protein LOC120553775 [Perca fluviatilis]
MSLPTLSSDELIQTLIEGGLTMTDGEAQKFRENEVDGETVHLGLTDSMLDHLFKGSFKKQAKFLQIVRQMQEPGHGEACSTQSNTQPNTGRGCPVTATHSTDEMYTEEMHTITFQVLDVDAATRTSSQSVGRLPDVYVLTSFPKELQAKLDAKEEVQRVPQYRHKIIRVLHETVAMYTMYPTHAEYVKVAQALIRKYPFLKDVTGNGYHTWHMSLKRKFKTERAPLVQNDEVKLIKEKFAHGKKCKQPDAESPNTCLRTKPRSELDVLGEDASSIAGHVKILQTQYSKAQPDTVIVRDLMQRTFAWRQNEIAEGMSVEDTMKKYPFLKTPSGLLEEVGRIHSTASISFTDGFNQIVPKVLALAQGKSPLAKQYLEAREEVLTEDLPGMDFRAALILLPIIFKESVDHHIMMGEGEPNTPYPIVQVAQEDWKSTFGGRSSCSLKVDGVEVCEGMKVSRSYASLQQGSCGLELRRPLTPASNEVTLSYYLGGLHTF